MYNIYMSKKKEPTISPEEMQRDLEERAERFINKLKKLQEEESMELFAHLRVEADGILPLLGVDDTKYKDVRTTFKNKPINAK